MCYLMKKSIGDDVSPPNKSQSWKNQFEMMHHFLATIITVNPIGDDASSSNKMSITTMLSPK